MFRAGPVPAMLEFYPQILSVHIASITLSGGWTGLRGLGLLFEMSWPRHFAARLLGWAIDGTVLTAAAMLLTILPSALFAADSDDRAHVFRSDAAQRSDLIARR